MHTVALAPRRDVEKAASEARASMVALMAAIDGRDLAQTAKASEKAYLAVGLLYALARAAESR
jgi:hypothetical protein